jgi:anti-sigma factor RsiW
MNASGTFSDGVYEQLVSYLDGELDAESSREVERRLAEDENYRRELQKLENAWDMLDELPSSEVSEGFTQTTVEMVALSAAQDIEQAKSQIKKRGRLVWALAGCSVLVAAGVGYAVMASLLAQPNRQLVDDLPVIENVELYRVADSVEFLRDLTEADLFGDEVEEDEL